MTFRRARHFIEREHVVMVTSQFLRASCETSVDILTYCFMPDHVHLLVGGITEKANCSDFIRRSKQYSGYHFRARTGQNLWQRDCYESIVNGDLEARAVSKYILANPVRGGLVERPHDYPFSGSFAWDARALTEVLDRVDYEQAQNTTRDREDPR